MHDRRHGRRAGPVRACAALLCAVILGSLVLAMPSSAYAAAVYAADPYEVPGDDTKDAARDITLAIAGPGRDPYVEQHTFDVARASAPDADEDWFRFYVTAASVESGVPYLFEALANRDSDVDPVLEVYGPGDAFTPTPGASLPPSSRDPVAIAGNLWCADWWDQRGASLVFRPTAVGWHYLRARPYGDTFGNYYDGAGRYVFRAKRGLFGRTYGLTRYETAAAISQERFADLMLESGKGENLSIAIIASGENFPDALAGASLTGVCQAPVLLTSKYRLNTPTYAELVRLRPDIVYVLGGPSAISDAVIEEIESIPPSWDRFVVERIAGEDRIGTALAIAERTYQLVTTPDPPWTGDAWPGVVFLCSSHTFADALSAGPMAGGRFAPILLTRPGSLDWRVRSYIAGPRVSDVVIVGGPAAVSAEIEAEVRTILGTSRVLRIAGANRYETSKAFATWASGLPVPRSSSVGTPGRPDALAYGDATAFVVCRGDAFPDALAAASICTQGWRSPPRPILLTPSGSTSPWLTDRDGVLPAGSRSWVEEVYWWVGLQYLDRGYIFGGPSAVSDTTFADLDQEG